MNTLEVLTTANKSTLKVITSVQKGVLDAQKEAASSLAGVETPSLPDWVPSIDVAATRDLLEESLTFPAKVLESHKAFALGLLDIWAGEKPAAAKK
jgi:hypothetical protein